MAIFGDDGFGGFCEGEIRELGLNVRCLVVVVDLM